MLEQKAEEHVKADNERYKQENYAGMSSRAGDYNDSASGARSNIDT